MILVCRELQTDLSRIPAQIVAVCTLLSGFIVCLALAAVVAFAALGQTARGCKVAASIMSLQGITMPGYVRMLVEMGNWLALAAIILFCAASMLSSLRGGPRRTGAAHERIYELSSESIGLSSYGG
jgi:hypothetical protein